MRLLDFWSSCRTLRTAGSPQLPSALWQRRWIWLFFTRILSWRIRFYRGRRFHIWYRFHWANIRHQLKMGNERCWTSLKCWLSSHCDFGSRIEFMVARMLSCEQRWTSPLLQILWSAVVLSSGECNTGHWGWRSRHIHSSVMHLNQPNPEGHSYWLPLQW